MVHLHMELHTRPRQGELQVCVATLLAQIGAWLPAESVSMSPADAIFVRMGAKDHIMLGQSTFFVELSETANMLASATRCASHAAWRRLSCSVNTGKFPGRYTG
jgi:hypothetical protein